MDRGLLPVDVGNALGRTQVDMSRAATRLASFHGMGPPPEDPTQLSFYEYLTGLAAAYDGGTAAAQAAAGAGAAAEAGTQQIAEALQSLDSLAVQASNDMLSSSDRQALQAQAGADLQQIAVIANGTAYNGTQLLNAVATTQVQPGPTPASIVQLHYPDATPAALGVANLDLSTTASAQAAETAVTGALASLGASQAQLGFQDAALESQIETNASASATLRDLAQNVATPDQVETIQRFKLDQTQETADFVTLARAARQDGVTLGLLDTSA